MSRPTLKMTKRDYVRTTACTRAMQTINATKRANGASTVTASIVRFERYGMAFVSSWAETRQKMPPA